MGFRAFYEEKELEDELKDLDFDGFSFDDLTDEEKQAMKDMEGEDDPDMLDIDDDGDVDEEDLDDFYFEEDELMEYLKEEELAEGKPKNAKDILQKRFKIGSKKNLLDKLTGGKKATPLIMAQFQAGFEFDKDLGKYGKWIKRKNKAEFKKKNPLKKLVKNIKMKAKRMRKMMKKGSVLTKIARGKAQAEVRTAGREIKLQGE